MKKHQKIHPTTAASRRSPHDRPAGHPRKKPTKGTPGPKAKSNMYAEAKTYNPFKGCEYECNYCIESFQRQAKRQMHLCDKCYHYSPHEHPERLNKIPSTPIVFVAGNADISFCRPVFTRQIIDAIKRRNLKRPDQTYYFQSKRPKYFEEFIPELPGNVILVTTLETNRDAGYKKVSLAPVPSRRYRQFLQLDYGRKVVTIEPVMDFDREIFADMIVKLEPEYAWLGFNSRPKQVSLPEPSEEKLQAFVEDLLRAGIEVRGKDLRGVVLPRVKV